MGASSVTGVGIGDSKGLQKPESNCGCGTCHCKGKNKKNCDQIPTPKKVGCHVNVSVGRSSSIRVGGGRSIKVCS